MKKIVLLGTNHAVQYRCALFKEVIKSLLERHESRTILEEVDWCEATMGHQVASEGGLLWHPACPPANDEFGPTNEIEAGMPIPIHRFGPIHRQTNRERFMQKRISEAMAEHDSGLFICGLGHLQSMAEKLISSGFEVEAYEWQQPSGAGG